MVCGAWRMTNAEVAPTWRWSLACLFRPSQSAWGSCRTTPVARPVPLRQCFYMSLLADACRYVTQVHNITAVSIVGGEELSSEAEMSIDTGSGREKGRWAMRPMAETLQTKASVAMVTRERFIMDRLTEQWQMAERMEWIVSSKVT